MHRMRRLSITLAGLAATAALASLAAQRAAHAVTAVTPVLVQAVNTALTPAITLGVPNMASQIVTLTGSVTTLAGQGESVLQEISPSGSKSSSFYTVPTGQSLVVNAIEFSPMSGSTGDATLELLRGANAYGEWRVGATTLTQLRWPSGIVLGPGTIPTVSLIAATSSKASFNIYIHGYLTAN